MPPVGNCGSSMRSLDSRSFERRIKVLNFRDRLHFVKPLFCEIAPSRRPHEFGNRLQRFSTTSPLTAVGISRQTTPPLAADLWRAVTSPLVKYFEHHQIGWRSKGPQCLTLKMTALTLPKASS